MALPVDSGVVSRFLTLYIPPGGNPAIPTNPTLPTDPQLWALHDGTGIPADVDNAVADNTINANQAEFEAGGTPEPVPLAARAVISRMSDWYVNQIWITPRPFDFGSIISFSDVEVNVLNTFRYEDRTLSNIDITQLGAGVTVDVDPTPVTMPPQGDTNFTLRADIEGPPRIDGDTILNFDNVSIAVPTTGTRLILFWWPPEQPLQERLSWFTDIVKNSDGDEQRQSLRTSPRQEMQIRYAGEDAPEMAKLRNTLLVFRGFTFGLPIWWEQQRVTAGVTALDPVIPVNTIGVDHRVGGAIIIFEPGPRTFTDYTIASFTDTEITVNSAPVADVSADALVVPVRFAQITADPQFTDQRTEWLTVQLRWQTEDNVDLAYPDQSALEADWPVHPEDGLPIIADCNVLSGNTQTRHMRGRVIREDPRIGIPLQVQKYPSEDIAGSKGTVDLEDLAAIRRYRSLLHYLRGSWGAVYIPTFRDDLPISQPFTLSASSIIVNNTGLVDLGALIGPHKSIMLELGDGGQYFAEVASVTELSDTEEQLNLVNPFDSMDATTINPGDGPISWLEKCRVEGDVATFIHKYAGLATLRFNFRALQQ